MKELLCTHSLSKRFMNPPMIPFEDLSFKLHEEDAVGLIGHSGSGKSTLARILVHLLPPSSGKITFRGVELTLLSPLQRKQFAKEVQIVFQDPYSALNPRMRTKEILEEPLLVHKIGSSQDRRNKILKTLSLVGLSSYMLDHFPHEFSGGQRQRLAIARALILEPVFLILDEPLSALDVSIQAQIVNLIKDLREELRIGYLFISHDQAMVRFLCDQIYVLHDKRLSIKEG